jgi:hypothetical protein
MLVCSPTLLKSHDTKTNSPPDTPKDCAIPGCRAPTHGRFCVTHRCGIKACESKIMSAHSKLCEHHTMCKLPGCSRRRYNNGFCVDRKLSLITQVYRVCANRCRFPGHTMRQCNGNLHDGTNGSEFALARRWWSVLQMSEPE